MHQRSQQRPLGLQSYKHGFGDIPVFLDEWNYSRSGEVEYSMNALKTHKGASFVSAVMSTAQKEKLDMLMYYDARPTVWNGIFGSYSVIYKPY